MRKLMPLFFNVFHCVKSRNFKFNTTLVCPVVLWFDRQKQMFTPLFFLEIFMKKITKLLITPALALAGASFTTLSIAETCANLPQYTELKKVLVEVSTQSEYPGGWHTPLWLVLVDSKGAVCSVVHSLDDKQKFDVSEDTQIAHRIIAAQKASTSNAFSSSTALSVASGNFFTAAQPGGLLQGMVYDNNQFDYLAGNTENFGTKKDPLIGKRVGGFTGAAGGLALFNAQKKKVGAIGIGGDIACTTHVLAWQVREKLGNGTYTAANVPFGLSATHDDKLIVDVVNNTSGGAGYSPSTFGHPACRNMPEKTNPGAAISIEFH